MKTQAFSATGISEAIVAFAQYARSNGLNIGIQETQDALLAASIMGVDHRETFKNILKPLFCTSPEERHAFEILFARFWDTNPVDIREKSKTKIEGSLKKNKGSLVMMGQGATGKPSDEGKHVAGANESERLRRTDFSKVNDVEATALEQIAEKLFKEMAARMSRRLKASKQFGTVHLRKTIRRNLNCGGEPIELFFKTHKPKKNRLIILLDASGSMDKYSFFLLRFIFALKEHFRQLEAFVFSTQLVRITHAVSQNKIHHAAEALAKNINNWSSGTKIGECLANFNEKYGKRMVNGSPTFIILSDGLDTGEPHVLGKELRKISCKTKRTIWLNPLKGMKDYQPIQRGMKEALPNIDVFRSAHNLNSLLELENLLSYA